MGTDVPLGLGVTRVPFLHDVIRWFLTWLKQRAAAVWIAVGKASFVERRDRSVEEAGGAGDL